MGRGSEQLVLSGASRRNQHRRYTIRGFDGYQDLEGFCRLMEFAQQGRVIVDWQAPTEDELWPGEEDGEYPPEDTPIYDETDLSSEPRYALAEALVAAAMFDYFVTDEDEKSPFLRVTTAFPQDELLADAASKTDLALAPLE